MKSESSAVPEPLVVFDCVVFLQALIKESGPAVTCLERFEEGRFLVAISPEVLSELRDVLSRSRLRQDFPLLTKERADRLIELLLVKGSLFRNVPKRLELIRDPGDEPYLNLAIEAGAQFLVTRVSWKLCPVPPACSGSDQPRDSEAALSCPYL
jgi:putative PIN family toxin of toxin-antitoxin system